MYRLLLISAVWCFASSTVSAETSRFPYTATVRQTEAEVRSGPGAKFYATDQLVRGDRVLVHRHDAGGWLLIEPPTGSFHYVACDAVESDDDQSGRITRNNVTAWVGSNLNDLHSAYGRALRRGEAVRILGREEITLASRETVAHYKIAPPPRCWRWIRGQDVTTGELSAATSADAKLARNASQRKIQTVSAQAQPAEFEIGEEESSSPPVGDSQSFDEDLNDVPRSRTAAKPEAETPAPIAAETYEGTITSASESRGQRSAINYFVHEQLDKIDAQVDSIVENDVTTWDFTQAEAAYLEVKERNSDQRYVSLIENRLKRLARFRELRLDTEELIRLGDQTMRRDQELAAEQSAITERMAQRSVTGGASTILTQGMIPTMVSGVPTEMPANGPAMAAANSVEVGAARPAVSAAAVSQTYSGAGIVRSVPVQRPGQPAFAITAHDGRILAYLAIPATASNIQAWVGRPAGVVGQRSFQPAVGADVINVSRLDSVNLAR